MYGRDLSVFSQTQAAAIMQGEGLVVARFWKTVLDDVHALRGAFAATAESAERFAFCVVIDEESSLPDGESRRALERVFGEYGPRLSAWSACVGGSGLKASSKRTMMRLIMTFGRIRCPWTVLPTPREALQWLDTTLDAPPGPLDVEHVAGLLASVRDAGPAAPA